MATAAMIAVSACGAQTQEPDCSGDRCDSAGSRDQLIAELEGLSDPIADMLREKATERGTLVGDYQGVLSDVEARLSCDPSRTRSFVVLSNNVFVPKTLFTTCSDSPTDASRLFVAVPDLHGDGSADVDPQVLHVSAWDQNRLRYNLYATFADERGEMQINVAPTFCLGCHGGPQELTYWQPLMNEMTNPWAGWNAEPGFTSQLFDEFLDGDTAAGEVYGEMTAPSMLESASNLEPIVRAGLSRVTNAKARERLGAADIETALSLVQPMFCDESINFVSEIHQSGELRGAAVIDDAIRSLLGEAGVTGPWSFLSDTTLRLPTPSSADPAITLFPVRGESTVQAELALVVRQVIAPELALRVRAIDWHNPVGSDARCDRFNSGSERIRAGALASLIETLPTDATTEALLSAVVEEMLRDDPVAPGADVVAVTDAGAESITLTVFGDRVQARWTAAEAQDSREWLRVDRDARACDAAGKYPITPLYPDLSCQ